MLNASFKRVWEGVEMIPESAPLMCRMSALAATALALSLAASPAMAKPPKAAPVSYTHLTLPTKRIV